MNLTTIYRGGAMNVRFVILGLLFAATANAQDRSARGDAQWMLERLTGVKWAADSQLISDMEARIAAGDKAGAAALATGAPQFLNVTVKQFAMLMSTREENLRQPFNDFTAGFMGVTRDGRDARELLYGDFFYSGNLTTPIAGVRSALQADLILSNNHYADLERANIDLGASLVRNAGQRIASSATANIPNPDYAGVITSRAFLSAHAIAGTNRRLVEYTFREFMCRPINDFADTSAPDDRIGRDIDRFPGGDNPKFLSSCKGCHTVMDGFRGAFAKWDFRDAAQAAIHVANGGAGNFAPNIDAISPNARGVVAKMNRPDFIQYAGGYVSTDDSFVNNANRGNNALVFGFRGLAPDNTSLAAAQTGAHAFGRLIANSSRFSQCMSKRVWSSVCRYELSASEADTLYVSLAMAFESNGYNMKKLFEVVAAHPKCRL